jgi:hypothetical protein
MRIGRRGILAGLGAAVCIALAVGWSRGWLAPVGERDGRGAPAGPAQGAKPTTLRPSGPDGPEIEITADHRLARIRHKDASGRSPYETVETPEGTVTIRRTFSADGKLLEEKAERDGKPVPVPRPE